MQSKIVVRLAALFVVTTSLVSSTQVAAQAAPEPPRNEFGVFGVLPLANGSLKGITSDRHFFLFGFSYSRLLGHSRVCDVRWVSEVMPVELLAEPVLKGTNVQTLSALSPFTETKVTYGVGTNPVGADAIFLPERKLQPFTGVHGGFSYFTSNVLDFEAAQFNFMLDGRAGVRMRMGGGKSLSVAYMFQHMSNAYAAVANPGVDSHMVHIAYAFPLRFTRKP